MLKEYQLNAFKNVRLLNQEPFIVAENDFLELKFSSEVYSIDNIIVTIKNGKKQSNFRLIDGVLKVPNEFIFAGELEITVNLIAKNEVAKIWSCEKILIKEIENGYNAVEYATDIENAISEQKKEIESISQKINELTKSHNELVDTLIELKGE